MPANDPAESALYRAIRRREELESLIKEAMQELDKIEQFVRTYREFADFQAPVIKGPSSISAPAAPSPDAKGIPPRKNPWGQAQPVFERLVRTVLRDIGRPMRSPEIIAEFQKRGHPIGGNETRTAWNRLWNAQKNKVLIQVPRYGYWLADEPVPPLPEKPQKHVKRGWGNSIRKEWLGRPPGRKKVLNDAQVKFAQELRASGKSYDQIAVELGGVSAGTVSLYLRRLEKGGAGEKAKAVKKKPTKRGKK